MGSRIELRSPREIKKMRKAGLVVWEAHQAAARILRPGITTREINEVYRDTFARRGATSLFLGYGDPPFPAETCISTNEEVVHGLPGKRVLKEGDIVSLDTGCSIDGWCGDAAVTHAIGKVSSIAQKLMQVTLDSLNLAIDLMDKETTWHGIAKQMEAMIHDNGFSIVQEMAGHGIGKKLHEPPSVPNYFDGADPRSNFDIRPGLVIAIEPMINAGRAEIVCLEDEWTIVTVDRKLSAHFEHTVAVTREGPIRLTGPPSDEELAEMPEWLHDRTQWVLW